LKKMKKYKILNKTIWLNSYNYYHIYLMKIKYYKQIKKLSN